MADFILFLFPCVLVSVLYFLSVSCISAVGEIAELVPVDLHTLSDGAQALKVCVAKMRKSPSKAFALVPVAIMIGAIHLKSLPIYMYMLPALCFIMFVLCQSRSFFGFIPGASIIEQCVSISSIAAVKLHEAASFDETMKFRGFQSNNPVDSEINAWGAIFENLTKMQHASIYATGYIAFLTGVALSIWSLA